jgi:uracil phosphoribosyltransferase
MSNLFTIGEQNSIANQYLSELRDQTIQQDRPRFRNNLRRLGGIMAYEISKKLVYSSEKVKTPLGFSPSSKLERQPVLITIMRAGLPYFNGFQDVFDEAESGFVGAYRQEKGNTLSIQLDYLATPSLADKHVILVDPMLATGRSLTDAVAQLVKRGEPKHLHVASVVASPEGIKHLTQTLTIPYTLWTIAVDEKLNSLYYIVPGLGDAGDLSFGPKS